MLDGRISTGTGGTQKPVHETKAFLIPLPPGSIAATTQYQEDGPDISRRVLDAMYQQAGRASWRAKNYIWSREWPGEVQRAYESYFLDRVNELGAEGWQLTHEFADFRLMYREFDVPRFLGSKRMRVITGAEFIMRRTTFQ